MQTAISATESKVTQGGRFPNNLHGALRLDGPRKTLVLFPIGIGNFLMLTPALKTLSDAVGVENLHLLALKGVIGTIAKKSGLFNTVHVWDAHKDSKSDGLKLINKLRSEKFDYSISLFPSGSWKFALFAALIHARTRVGFVYPHDTLPRFVQTISVPLNPALHDTDQNSDLVEALIGQDINGSKREMVFPYDAEEQLLAKLRDKQYFVCHPGSSTESGMKEKRLPPAAFAEVISLIYEKYQLKCVLIGGPEELDLRSEIAKLVPEAILDYSSKSFNELRSLIEGSQFYLGNDSGLMHTATSTGKRCIAFFGPTDDRRTGPYDEGLRTGTTRHLIVRNPALSCTPCWTIHTTGKNPPCQFGDTRCMQKMEIKTVWPKIDQYIGSLPSI